VKIHEYQAKELFAKYGVPVPKGGVVSTPEEAKKIAGELGGTVVIKAQVYAGGRGKGGGIKTAQSPDEAEKLAGQIIGMRRGVWTSRRWLPGARRRYSRYISIP
jgi:succinyl-CoA synthetase beta subunit